MTSNHEIQSNDPRNDDKSSRTRHPNHANPSRPSKSTIPTPGRDDIQPERTTNDQDDAIQKKNIKVGSHVEPMIGELFECHRWLLTKFETRCVIEQVWSTITNDDLESRQRLCSSRCVRLILLCVNAILIVVISYIIANVIPTMLQTIIRVFMFIKTVIAITINVLI
jgi:hypothetical protein